MKSKKRTKTTEITVEKSEVLVIHKTRRTVFADCQDCGTSVKWITPEEAAALAQKGPRHIYRWIEMGKIHFRETPEGLVLVCRNSLPC